MNKIFRFSALIAAVFATNLASAIGPQNSRATTAGNVAPARAAGREVQRVGEGASARSIAARSSTVSRAAATPGIASRADVAAAARNARNATTISRSAVAARSARVAASPVRSAVNTKRSNVSRAAQSRATAIFEDVSKIGGGYAKCREAYATCMDQFCAKASDTYRRCFCSDRFTGFRETEDALDQAKILLQQFEDNNLNAVDKTAAEVSAMYSATVGETAIKNDISGAASLLAEISDLMSGKKKAFSSSSSTSLGVMSLDFSSDIGDIWGGSSSVSSIFGGGSGVDVTSLEGEALFNQVHKQCSALVSENCQSNAVANMAKSAYGIMITQDCNAYERSIDTKRQQVQNTVRQAEKILREARLEEYRAHNSQDVNDCLDKVRAAMLSDTACGANYKRCLDYSGAYINQSTGEPIYSQRLFELTDLILLDGASGGGDVLTKNEKFNQFLESRKMFATSALDSCRDISELVWTEFKRTALIEIAQAQDEKIESVKSSCLEVVRECYDTQSDALKSFDDTTADAAGAMSAYVARSMCQEKVVACASLYGETGDCKFDGNGKLLDGGRCGLSALLEYVDAVDTVRAAEGCEVALTNYVTEMCTPTTDFGVYPQPCATLSQNDLEEQIKKRASLYCIDGAGVKYDKYEDGAQNFNDTVVEDKITSLINRLMSDISSYLKTECEAVGGLWYVTQPDGTNTLSVFYHSIAGKIEDLKTYGVCVEQTVKLACERQDELTGNNGYATYNYALDTCELSDEWYQFQCTDVLGGTWSNDVCSWVY